MNIRIIHVTPSDKNSGPVNVARDICAGFNERNYRTLLFNLRGNGRHNLLTSFISLFNLVLKNKDVIVHSHGIIPDFFMFIISNVLRVDWFSTVHCDPEEDLKFIYPKSYKIITYIWLNVLKKANKVIFLTNYISNKQRLTNKVVVHNSRKIEKTVLSEKNQYDNVKIGFCGALIERKNILSLVESFPEDDKYKLLIAGDGPLLPWLKIKIKDRKNKNIELLGQKDNLNEFWSDIDILVLPSFAEGVPLVAIESLSKNIPLILMDLKNYQGVFSENEAVFINEINEQSLKLSIEKIHDDYNIYSHSAGESFLNNFNFEIWIKKISAVYCIKD